MALDFGICFHRDESAGDVVERVRVAEECGFDEFWVIEDCFFTSGVALASAALTATSSIGVGIGIMPAVARNPAITAMEIATLSALAPGRFHAGIGHGVQEWMQQMGARVGSPVTVLSETVDVVQRLLRGDEVSFSGRYTQLDAVKLDAPPDPRPLVSAGVRGPVSLAAMGPLADGVILADFCSPAYVASAREQLMAAGARSPRVTVFASMAVGDDGDLMRSIMTPFLAEVCATAPTSLAKAPFWDELSTSAGDVGWEKALAAMPLDWWHQLGPIGSPDDASAYLEGIDAAGADCVATFPSPVEPLEDTRSFAADVIAAYR